MRGTINVTEFGTAMARSPPSVLHEVSYMTSSFQQVVASKLRSSVKAPNEGVLSSTANLHAHLAASGLVEVSPRAHPENRLPIP